MSSIARIWLKRVSAPMVITSRKIGFSEPPARNPARARQARTTQARPKGAGWSKAWNRYPRSTDARLESSRIVERPHRKAPLRPRSCEPAGRAGPCAHWYRRGRCPFRPGDRHDTFRTGPAAAPVLSPGRTGRGRPLGPSEDIRSPSRIAPRAATRSSSMRYRISRRVSILFVPSIWVPRPH